MDNPLLFINLSYFMSENHWILQDKRIFSLSDQISSTYLIYLFSSNILCEHSHSCIYKYSLVSTALSLSNNQKWYKLIQKKTSSNLWSPSLSRSCLTGSCNYRYFIVWYTNVQVMFFFNSYVISEILSGESRESIVENIHSKLIEVGQKVKEGQVEGELYHITKVSSQIGCQVILHNVV